VHNLVTITQSIVHTTMTFSRIAPAMSANFRRPQHVARVYSRTPRTRPLKYRSLDHYNPELPHDVHQQLAKAHLDLIKLNAQLDVLKIKLNGQLDVLNIKLEFYQQCRDREEDPDRLVYRLAFLVATSAFLWAVLY
jgi:hypothetical protein